jgi:NAD(P)H-quinone oxidoreductase subunit 5
MQPLALNGVHLAGIIMLTLAWLSILFWRHALTGQGNSKGDLPSWVLKAYAKALNASQPHPATITAHHNHYKAS